MFIEIIGAGALLVIGFFIGRYYERYLQKKTKTTPSEPPKPETKPPEYNPDYLTAEESFTFDDQIIDQFHHNIQGARDREILGVDPNNASQCRKLVMIKLAPEEDVYDNETINNFWKSLKKQNKLTINRYYHIVVEYKNMFYVANACLGSDGNLNRDVSSLANGDRWDREDGHRFLLPRLAVS